MSVHVYFFSLQKTPKYGTCQTSGIQLYKLVYMELAWTPRVHLGIEPANHRALITHATIGGGAEDYAYDYENRVCVWNRCPGESGF